MTQDTAWTVKPGYEAVRDAFVANLDGLGIGGGAYCAYVDGEVVVDLWGGEAQPGQPWEEGSTAVIMSATKGFAVLCAQVLVDRGQLDLDAPVSRYWPEFAQNGKEGVLVRHVLAHTAGVLGYDGAHEVTRLDGTGWDQYERIAEGFAASAPEWQPGTRHGYHALSVGWLLGELVRRVTGRSLGTFFRQEVGEPLSLECWIGTPPEELHRVARVHKAYTARLPTFLQRFQEVAEATARDPGTLFGKAFLADGTRSGVDELEVIFNNPVMLQAEFPAGSATCNARALARTWQMMCNGGELEGHRILSPEIVEAWGTVVQNEPDALMSQVNVAGLAKALTKGKTPRTIGYLGNNVIPGVGSRFGPNPTAFGAEGMGGQEGFCDRESRVAVGFVRSDHAVMDVLQPQLTNVLYDCARRAGKDVYGPAPLPAWKAFALNRLGNALRPRLTVPTAAQRV